MLLKTFFYEESGAVTVDWVVLTAGIVGLGLATTAVVSGGVSDLAGDVDTQMTDMEITTEFAAAIAGIEWGSYTGVSLGVQNWGINVDGENWAQDTYGNWSQLDDTTVMAMYTEQYGIASSGGPGSEFHAQRADYITVTEQILNERDIDIPDGNMTAEELRAIYE